MNNWAYILREHGAPSLLSPAKINQHFAELHVLCLSFFPLCSAMLSPLHHFPLQSSADFNLNPTKKIYIKPEPKMQLCKTLTHSPPRIILPRRISQPWPPLHAPTGFLHSHPQASSFGCSWFGLSVLKYHPITACIGACRDATAHQLELEAEVDEIKGTEMGTFMVAPEDASGGDLSDQGLWDQIKEIAKFVGPATGLWVCGPLMSLIDTAVIGQGSSIELAALGNNKFVLLV